MMQNTWHMLRCWPETNLSLRKISQLKAVVVTFIWKLMPLCRLTIKSKITKKITKNSNMNNTSISADRKLITNNRGDTQSGNLCQKLLQETEHSSIQCEFLLPETFKTPLSHLRLCQLTDTVRLCVLQIYTLYCIETTQFWCNKLVQTSEFLVQDSWMCVTP